MSDNTSSLRDLIVDLVQGEDSFYQTQKAEMEGVLGEYVERLKESALDAGKGELLTQGIQSMERWLAKLDEYLPDGYRHRFGDSEPDDYSLQNFAANVLLTYWPNQIKAFGEWQKRLDENEESCYAERIRGLMMALDDALFPIAEPLSDGFKARDTREGTSVQMELLMDRWLKAGLRLRHIDIDSYKDLYY